jgi:hypothetical protein
MKLDDREIGHMLPWYVNGSADSGVHGKLESHLERLPHLRGEVAWLRQLRQQIRASDASLQRPADAGLDSLMSLIHAEQSGKLVPLRKPANRWTWDSAPRWLPAAASLAAAVVFGQAVLLGALLNRPAGPALSALSGAGPTGGALLQLTFRSRATEVQIRTLLLEIRGEIVAGPGALGVYTVRVPEGQGNPALARLRGDRLLIDSVVLLRERQAP